MNKDDLMILVSQLNIDDGSKSEILDFIRNGQIQNAVRLLKQYRSTALDNLHSDQNKLYQIDFVLQKAKKPPIR